MSTKAGLLFLLASSSALFCQTSSSSRPEVSEGGKVYVRRFTLGATLTVPGLSLMPRGSANPIVQSPPTDSLYSATNNSYRPGYGVMTQLVIKGRFAVNASLLLRRVGYKLNSDIYEGATTIEGSTTHIVRDEDTRAKFVDLPVTVRYYFKDRHAPGARFFVEGGAALRRVYQVRTSISETVDTGTSTTTNCCTTTPAAVRRTVRGFVAGLGFQVIEPMGIRIIPAFRYTRWMGRTFESAPVPTRRDQIEGMVSLSF